MLKQVAHTVITVPDRGKIIQKKGKIKNGPKNLVLLYYNRFYNNWLRTSVCT
jgi:hypothetical protein